MTLGTTLAVLLGTTGMSDGMTGGTAGGFGAATASGLGAGSGGWLVMAAIAVACAVLVGGGGRRLSGPRSGRARPGVRMAAVVLGAAAVTSAARPSLVVLVLIVGATGAAAERLWRRRQQAREIERTRRRVVEACEVLGGELAAGRSPADALQQASSEWPALAPAARVGLAGGSVPEALRALADSPGARDVRVVAAAWQVAHRTGHGLADALERVAAQLRAAEGTRRVVAGELASARATARLVAALPVAALVMGSSTGADPWGFLLTEPLGLACLAGGLACGLAGLGWIEAIAAGVER